MNKIIIPNLIDEQLKENTPLKRFKNSILWSISSFFQIVSSKRFINIYLSYLI